jgi:23S rRNA (cytosine1962-C5)-methyltransferase
MLQIFLKLNRDMPIRRGHPWIFSGAIERCQGDDQIVDVADIFDNKNNWLGRGLYNPKSTLRVRLLTWKKRDHRSKLFRQPPVPGVGLSRRAIGRGQ